MRREKRETCRSPFTATVVAAIAIAALGGSPPRALVAEKEGNVLVGSWEREGRVVVFAPDGTGKNHDGSRFRWVLEGGRLTVRAEAPDGTLGPPWSTPIAFGRDNREYSYLLGSADGGWQAIVFRKLGPGDGDRPR